MLAAGNQKEVASEKGETLNKTTAVFKGQERAHALTGLEVKKIRHMHTIPHPVPDRPQVPDPTLTTVGQSLPFLEEMIPAPLHTWRSFCLRVGVWVPQTLDQVEGLGPGSIDLGRGF